MPSISSNVSLRFYPQAVSIHLERFSFCFISNSGLESVNDYKVPAVARKKVTAAFDGGWLTSDGCIMLLAAAERRLGIADRLAALIATHVIRLS